MVRIRLPSFGTVDFEAITLRGLVRPREQDQRRAGARFPMRLERRDLRGLVLDDFQAMQVARDDLQRHDDAANTIASWSMSFERCGNRPQQIPRRRPRRRSRS